MELDYKAIGKRVKIAREKQNMTQEELASKAVMSCQHISNIENAKTKLSLPAIVTLANHLNVSVDKLLCDNVVHSKEIFCQEIQEIVEDCDDYEIYIITELVKASKEAIRRNKRLQSKL